MIKNLLDDIKYVEPDLSLPIPEGMCNGCVQLESRDLCAECKQQGGDHDGTDSLT
jgi:hypothetical protein